jgi:molybdenum cofactor guanylyltransferase
MTSHSLNAIVLAGGLSSRMGQDKALIPVEGTPMLLRVCDVALGCAEQVYVVTPWAERYRELLAGQDWVERIRLVAETGQAGQGPLLGFLQGLEALVSPQAPDWVLLLACDLPNLQPEILQQWMLKLPELPETVIAALPKSQDWWEPLCGFYRVQCQTSLRAFVEDNGKSFQGWLEQESVTVLPLADQAMLLNCNRPKDLQQLG